MASIKTRDVVILTNGPGELATWVRPVVQQLRQQWAPDEVRVSIVLSPCPNATGREAEVAKRFPGVDRVQGAEHFMPFLLWGRTAEGWDWHDRGVVLFLGGDQFYTVVIGKRLGYRMVIYAEWEARWYRCVDRIGAMNPSVGQSVPKAHAHKLSIVGDLMADVASGSSILPAKTTATPVVDTEAPPPMIGLLPGSKDHKLTLGVPMLLAIVAHIRKSHPTVRFVLPVAPTISLVDLARFADPAQNPIIEQWGWGQGYLAYQGDQPVLRTDLAGELIDVELHQEFPAYDLLAQCQCCLTTVGANTAELGALAIPMLVLIPTQQLDIMRTWDGLLGIIMNLPWVGSGISTAVNWYLLRQMGLVDNGKPRRLFAWPNLWAGEEVVPELVGKLQPKAVAERTLAWLAHPDQLEAIRDRLRQLRGASGAASQLAAIVTEELNRVDEAPRQ